MTSLYALKLTITNFCGYKCKYCYVNTYNKDVISEKLMYNLIDFYMYQKGKEKIIFFLGGEALLKFSILKKGIIYARNKEKKLLKKLRLFITTSGLSITDSKILFLSKNNVKIGLSIDGNKYIHGINRISNKGINTYDNTIKALKLLNKYYNDKNLGYALTVNENTVKFLFSSFIFLSNLDKERRVITIAGSYDDLWNKNNIFLLESLIKKICNFIFNNINNKEYYYYDFLDFFILEKIKGNNLYKGNIEIHAFPNGDISLNLFYQSIFLNKFNDPTGGRFKYLNLFADKIIQLSYTNKNYTFYIKSLYKKPIL